MSAPQGGHHNFIELPMLDGLPDKEKIKLIPQILENSHRQNTRIGLIEDNLVSMNIKFQNFQHIMESQAVELRTISSLQRDSAVNQKLLMDHMLKTSDDVDWLMAKRKNFNAWNEINTMIIHAIKEIVKFCSMLAVVFGLIMGFTSDFVTKHISALFQHWK